MHQHRLYAGIAQLVEHDLAKVGVASSNLVSRSNFYTPNYCETFAFDSMRPLWARDRVSAIASQRVQTCFPLQFVMLFFTHKAAFMESLCE